MSYNRYSILKKDIAEFDEITKIYETYLVDKKFGNLEEKDSDIIEMLTS